MDRFHEQLDLRSEEVQEVLGTPPAWIVRWGTIVACAVFIGLIWLAFWMRYPDVVETSIRVTTSDPPRKVYATQPSVISEMLVSNEDTVERGQTLIVFESQKANYRDVHHLEDQMLAVPNLEDSSLLEFQPERGLLLGSLQADLYDFLDKQSELRNQYRRRDEKVSIRELRRRQSKAERDLYASRAQKEKLEEQIDMVSMRYSRTKSQWARKEEGITFADVRQIEEKLLELDREQKGLEAKIRDAEFEFENLQRQIGGLDEVTRESMLAASGRCEEAFVRLQNKLADWKSKFLIMAPIRGVVVFSKDDLNASQYVTDQEALLMVLPLTNGETLGRMSVDLSSSGKVKVGQRVVIKLNSFPFHEYGAVNGEVIWKGSVPNNNAIPVEVHFPNGLQTHTGRQIDPVREMTGTAEIITEDKRFIDRIFSSLRRVTS